MCAPSLDRLHRLSIPVSESGCWIWVASSDRNGYGKVKVNKQNLRAHRWSWELHNGTIPDDMQVLHRCDVPSCVNPEHLFIGTNQDNVDDRESKGRSYKLPIHRTNKVSESDVLEIRRLKGTVRVVDLASRYGLHYSQISRIQNRRYWKHIDAEERMG